MKRKSRYAILDIENRLKEDLEEIVEVIGSEKVILLGQSWGSILAAEYIADNPGRVAKVIFTGPGYILPVNYALAAIPAPDSLDLRTPRFTNKQGREKIVNCRARAAEWCAKIFGFKLASDREMDEFETEYFSLFTNHRFIVVPDAGHSIVREQPELYINNILEFLN